jgi:hypothetical protein
MAPSGSRRAEDRHIGIDGRTPRACGRFLLPAQLRRASDGPIRLESSGYSIHIAAEIMGPIESGQLPRPIRDTPRAFGHRNSRRKEFESQIGTRCNSG